MLKWEKDENGDDLLTATRKRYITQELREISREREKLNKRSDKLAQEASEWGMLRFLDGKED